MRITLFLIAFLIISSCKLSDKNYIASGSKKDSSYTILDSVGTTSYVFHFAPEHGVTYYYTINTKAEVKQEVIGKEIETNSISKTAFHLKREKDADGNIKLLLTYDDFKLNASSNGQELVVDATNPDKSMHAEMFGALKGAFFTAQVSPKGEIINLKGVKELQDTMYKLSGADPMQKELLASTLDKIISQNAIKEMLGPDYSEIPKRPVQIGESWKSTTNSTQFDLKIPITITYTLEDVTNGIGTIEMTSNIKLDNQEVQMQGYIVKTTLLGKQEGELKLNMITGTVEYSEQEINLKGKLQLMGNDVPISVHYQNSLKKVK